MLGDITLPSTLSSIGEAAFMGAGTPADPQANQPLTTVTIPAGVVTIEVAAFQDCRFLQTLIFADNAALISIERSVRTLPCRTASVVGCRGNAAWTEDGVH